MYAHTIARMLDPAGKLFAHRIRSRDECFNAFSKSHDLRLVLLCNSNAGLNTSTYLLSIGEWIYFLETNKLKMNQTTYPIWEVKLGLCWKVTFMQKRVYKK